MPAQRGPLAFVLDGLSRLLLFGVEKRRSRALWISALSFGALYVYAGSTWIWAASSRGPAAVTIGAKTFTEQYILSEILAQTIRDRTGAPTQLKQSLGSTVVFDALVSGQVDVYVDYSGTIWTTIMGRSDSPADRGVVIGNENASCRHRQPQLLDGGGSPGRSPSSL